MSARERLEAVQYALLARGVLALVRIDPDAGASLELDAEQAEKLVGLLPRANE